jgi:excisionase family DNA binding protein
MIDTNRKKKLTPPEIARLWGVSADKVLTWIRSGELKAMNAATS